MMRRLPVAFLLLFATAGMASDQMRIEVVKMSVYIHVAPGAMLYSVIANIVLPNGDHATISCTRARDHCSEIESFAPEKMPPNSRECAGDICTTTDLGTYTATRKGNDLTIQCPREKLKFHIDGSW